MKYLSRGIWFIAGRMMTLALVLGLIVTAFYYTMNLNNIQIILKDGMANRAKYVMGMQTNRNTLSKYFQNQCISTDPLIQQADNHETPYENYNIRGIDHRLDMGFVWLWPWDESVRMVITERIPRIDGRVMGLKADEMIEKNGENALYPPAWKEASYQVLVVKDNGQWKIRRMTEIVKEEQ